MKTLWKKKTVLVTGAGGFIGSHLAEHLVSLGAHVRVLIRYNSTGGWGWIDHSSRKKDMEVFLGDIRDRESLQAAFQKVDIVFHLAALIGIPYSYHSPVSYMRTNIEGTLNILQLARDHNIERLVHTSTSETYGTALRVPIDEDHPLQGQSPYSASKIAADKFAEAFHLSYGLPVSIARPFNVYGPRQSARAIIPTIVTQALTQNRLRLGNTKPIRDLNYVQDTVQGFIRMAECPAAIGKVINIGSGQEISIGQLAERILRRLGKNIPIETEAIRKRGKGTEVERLCADNKRAREILNWRSDCALDEGLDHTIDWIKKHIELYRTELYAI